MRAVMRITRLSTLLVPTLTLALLPLAPSGAVAAEPAVISDGFGAASTFDTTSFAAFGNSAATGGLVHVDLAMPFTVPPTRSYHLHAIDLAITASSGSPAVEVRILGTDPGPSAGGLPRESLILDRVTLVVPRLDDRAGPPGPLAITHLDLSQGPALRPGALYWLALSALGANQDATLSWWAASRAAGGAPAFVATRSNLGPWRPTEAPGLGLAARIIVTPVPSHAATGYTFTKIADTRGPFRTFPRPALVALSPAGTVVFRAELDTGSMGIFSNTGGIFSAVAESGQVSAEFSQLDSFPSLNANGLVAWRGTLRGGAEGIFLRQGSSLTAVVNTRDRFHTLGHPSVNAAGTVAFLAGLDGRGGGVFTATPGTVGAIAHTDGPFEGFLGRPSMNAKGTVAFGARLDSGEMGIYSARPGSRPTAIADTTGPFTALRAPCINDRGTIAFHACMDEAKPDCPPAVSAVEGLFAGNGGPLLRIADTSGAFDWLGNPVLNNAGQAAFVARLNSGQRGIYTGPDPERDKVLVTGDSLFGTEVTDLGFIHGLGLNDLGQIAFYARLRDGTEGIFLASPYTPVQ